MDTKASNSSGWENAFRSLKQLFEQATGNDKPKSGKYFNSIMTIILACQLWQHYKVL